MSQYSQYIYYSQKEFKHFGLEMSLLYGILAHFESKIYEDFWTISNLFCAKLFEIFSYILGQNVPKKSDKENFELYQIIIYNFLCQSVPILIY